MSRWPCGTPGWPGAVLVVLPQELPHPVGLALRVVQFRRQFLVVTDIFLGLLHGRGVPLGLLPSRSWATGQCGRGVHPRLRLAPACLGGVEPGPDRRPHDAVVALTDTPGPCGPARPPPAAPREHSRRSSAQLAQPLGQPESAPGPAPAGPGPVPAGRTRGSSAGPSRPTPVRLVQQRFRGLSCSSAGTALSATSFQESASKFRSSSLRWPRASHRRPQPRCLRPACGHLLAALRPGRGLPLDHVGGLLGQQRTPCRGAPPRAGARHGAGTPAPRACSASPGRAAGRGRRRARSGAAPRRATRPGAGPPPSSLSRLSPARPCSRTTSSIHAQVSIFQWTVARVSPAPRGSVTRACCAWAEERRGTPSAASGTGGQPRRTTRLHLLPQAARSAPPPSRAAPGPPCGPSPAGPAAGRRWHRTRPRRQRPAFISRPASLKARPRVAARSGSGPPPSPRRPCGGASHRRVSAGPCRAACRGPASCRPSAPCSP